VTGFVITDPLDKGLSKITVLNDGQYDEQTHTVTWNVKELSPKEKGFVEFIAEVGATKEIHNQAYVKKYEEGPIETNIVVTKVFVSPKLGWIPFHKESEPREPPSSNMKDETTMGITVNFDISGMFVQEVKVDGVKYHRTSIPGHANLINIGEPELPIVGQIIEIPFGVNLKPKVVKSESIELKGYNIYPAQEPVPRNKKRQVTDQFKIDKNTYTNKVLYPSELVKIKPKDLGVIRGHRVVFLKVNPVQANPVSRQMRVFSNIEVRLEYDRPGQITRVKRRIESRDFEEMLKGLILNYKNQYRFTREETDKEKEAGCHYLILTHSDFYQATDANNPIVRLRNWKQKKGLTTKVVDVATIAGGNTANSIETYMQNVYDNWDPVPTYVLLVGDADFIPTNNGTNHSSHRNTPIGTDLNYSTLDGVDYFPDIFIGRLSVETLQQAIDVVAKIIDYEQNPPATPANDDFYRNTSLVGLFEDVRRGVTNPNGIENPTFRIIENAEAIRNYLIGQGYNVERIYDQSGNWPQGPQTYEDGISPVPVDLTIAGNPPAIPGFPWNGGTGDIQAAINGGNFIATYDGHGDRRDWSQPSFDTGDVAGLNNGNLTPVVFVFACMSGWFDNETDNFNAYPPPPTPAAGTNNDCFCELILREAGNGAVATVGATRISWEHNDFMMIGVYKALWPNFVPNPPVSGIVPQMQMGPLVRMGQIHNFCKFYMANRYTHDWYRESSFEMYHLFGDPEMPVWTQAPLNLRVNHPVGIGSVGEQDFIVRVTDSASGDPVQSAVIALTQRKVVAGEPVDIIRGVEQTNPDGIARFTLHSIPAGDLDITVTAHNFRQYSGVIKVSSVGATLNRLDPDNGIEGQVIHVGGQGFSGNENIKIYFGDQYVLTTAASSGEFGQVGSDVDINVPTPYDLGPVNVVAHSEGGTDRYAVDVFQVRSQNPIDLFTYSQRDESTWHLTPGDDPTWNNPEIQLYDGATPVASNNLIVGTTYNVKLKVHNETNFKADNVKIVYKWCNYGIGGPWYDFHTDSRDVQANSITESEAPFTPAATGHLCMSCEIHHIEDINTNNNRGQENLHVGPTASPTKVCFLVWNLTKKPATVFLEVRQLIKPKQRMKERLWATWVKHPDPQVLKPEERAEACLIVDPDVADVEPGTKAEFAVTGFIDGKMIGGVNVELTKSKQIEKK